MLHPVEKQIGSWDKQSMDRKNINNGLAVRGANGVVTILHR